MSRIDNNTGQLTNSTHKFLGKVHIPRQETDMILDWIKRPTEEDDNICLLIGTAGQGKTVVLHDLTEQLKGMKDGRYYAFGVKADMLDFEAFRSHDEQSNYEGEMAQLKKNGIMPVLIIDQIDTLSKSLSTDRKPIAQLDALIGMAMRTGAKVVVSCRPYDLNYDPVLKKYKHRRKIGLGNLTLEQVNYVLKECDKSEVNANGRMYKFLSTPVNLEYFIEYGKDGSEDVSLKTLMDQMWTVKIEEVAMKSDRTTPERLTDCLKAITDILNNTSTLTIKRQRLEGKYKAETDYLVSENVLRQDDDNNQISFYHQTLADYVTARVTYEKGETMSTILEHSHQGLYIRNRVKQYFTYIRETAPDEYINEVKKILVDAPKGTYREHIRMLLLTTMASMSEPLDEEKAFAGRYVMEDDLYRDVFVDAVMTEGWFSYVTGNAYVINALRKKDENMVELMKRCCINMLYVNGGIVMDYLLSLIREGDVEWNRNWMGIVNGQAAPTILEQAKKLFDASAGDDPLKYNNYLRHLAETDYQYVEGIILAYIEKRLKAEQSEDDGKTMNFRLNYMDSQTYFLLEELYHKTTDKDRVAKTYLKVIEAIDTATMYEASKEMRFTESSAYYGYSSSTSYDYHDRLVSDYLAYAKEKGKGDAEFIRPIIEQCLSSKHGIVYYMGICLIRDNLEAYRSEALAIVKDREILEVLSGKISYQVIKLLEALFPTLTEEEKTEVVDTVTQVTPSWQNTAIPDMMKYGVPLYHIGRRKQELLWVIPHDYLKTNRPDDWKYLQEKNREFKKPSISEPFKTYTKGGWTSHGLDKMRAMKKEQMLNAFRKVNSNITTIDDKPTLQGECMNFEALASEAPEKYYPYIEAILEDKRINREYAAYGISALKKAEYDIEKIKLLTDQLVEELMGMPQERSTEMAIMDVLRDMDYFIERNQVSAKMLDFMCWIAKEYPDEERDGEDQAHRADVYNIGINRVRGSAVYHLVKCNGMDEQKDEIFKALEACKDATPATKAAIILQQALLNYLDYDRNYDLYMTLTKDLTPSLMSIPLSNVHPLLYFINNRFDDLEEFFLRLYDVEASHEMLSELLWIAFARKINGSKEMLHGLLDKSDKAKKSLLQYFHKDTVAGYFDYVLPVVEWCKDSDDSGVGKMYDFLMNDLEDIEWEKVKEVIDIYISGKAFGYAGHQFLELMKERADEHPEDVLRWMCAYTDTEHLDDDNVFLHSQAMSVIVAAYSAIRKYDKESQLLEDALKAMDKLLADREVRRGVKTFLYELDH